MAAPIPAALRPGTASAEGSLRSPVHQLEPLDPLKFPDVVTDQRGAQSQGMAGDQEVIGPDGGALPLQGRRLLGVVEADPRPIWVENRDLAGQGVPGGTEQPVGLSHPSRYAVPPQPHAAGSADRLESFKKNQYSLRYVPLAQTSSGSP